jgi:hypothetical protein
LEYEVRKNTKRREELTAYTGCSRVITRRQSGNHVLKIGNIFFENVEKL